MSTTRKYYLVILCGLLTVVAYCQVKQNQSDTVASNAGTVDKDRVAALIAKASENTPESIYFVEQLAKAKAVQVVPMLEEKFVHTQDAVDKAHIASALVRLGDKDDIYWDFLVKQATQAVESDAPDFMNFDPQAKTGAGPSPEFIAWAKAHNVPPNGPNGTAAEDAMHWLPGKVMLLGITGDPRAIPLLRQALLSPNHMIEIAAAKGLAEIQDKDSIPLIIEACKRAPAAAAAVIAESLVYFDDADAQRAVDTYVPKDRAKILREARAQGKKTPWGY
ncbi:MAG: HEAT repeat domain-containing protein [Terriglobales bacterium]